MHLVDPMKVGRRNDFIRLPCGDHIRPSNIDAIRVSQDKADRRTGEVGTRVFVQHLGSWYTIGFADPAQATAYADALGALCDRVARGEVEAERGTGFLGRAAAAGFIEELRQPDGHDADDEASDD